MRYYPKKMSTREINMTMDRTGSSIIASLVKYFFIELSSKVVIDAKIASAIDKQIDLNIKTETNLYISFEQHEKIVIMRRNSP